MKKIIFCIAVFTSHSAYSAIPLSCGDLEKILFQSHDFRISSVNYNDGMVYGHAIKQWLNIDLNSITKKFDECIAVYDKKKTATYKLHSKRKSFLKQIKSTQKQLTYQKKLIELRSQLTKYLNDFENIQIKLKEVKALLNKNTSSSGETSVSAKNTYAKLIAKSKKITTDLILIDNKLNDFAKSVDVTKRYLFLDRELIAKLANYIEIEQQNTAKHKELKSQFSFDVEEIARLSHQIAYQLKNEELVITDDLELEVKYGYDSINDVYKRLQLDFEVIKKIRYDYPTEEFFSMKNNYVKSINLFKAAVKSYKDKWKRLENDANIWAAKYQEIRKNTDNYINKVSPKSSLVNALLSNNYVDGILTISSYFDEYYKSSNSIFSCFEERLENYAFELSEVDNILTISFGNNGLLSFDEIVSFKFAYVDERFILADYSDTRIKGELSGIRKLQEVTRYIKTCEQKNAILLGLDQI